MFQPNYPKAAIGLEKQFVTALSLQKEGRGVVGIRQAATVDLPNGLLTPNFLERNISNHREMASVLEEVCVRAGLQGQKRWSVSLPGNTARTAVLTLDSVPSGSKELEEILDWKAETSFGAPAVELRIARKRIGSDVDGKARFFATAVKLSVIDEYETLFESFGWQAGLVMPRAVCEANWLTDRGFGGDSLLISSQYDGFTAVLLRGGEPVVVRNVTCGENEADDEIYRLLMFYNDRLAASGGDQLGRVLLIGKSLKAERIREISSEALGRSLNVLRPDEVGFSIPSNGFSFDDLAAPAGIAAMGL